MHFRLKRAEKQRILTFAVSLLLIFGLLFGIVPVLAATSIGNVTSQSEDGNVLIFNCDSNQVKVELCTARRSAKIPMTPACTGTETLSG